MFKMDDQVEAGELLGGGEVLNAERGQSGDDCDEERNYEDQHMTTHLPGRPLRINFMSRYICFSQIDPFDVSFEELFSKVQNPGGFFRKIVF